MVDRVLGETAVASPEMDPFGLMLKQLTASSVCPNRQYATGFLIITVDSYCDTALTQEVMNDERGRL
jgi:hypothetical protein